MDAFQALMVGTNFSGKNNEEARRLWRSQRSRAAQSVASDPTLSLSGEQKHAIAAPPPSHSLSLAFDYDGTQHQQQGHAGRRRTRAEAEAEAEAAEPQEDDDALSTEGADGADSEEKETEESADKPLKPMTYKQMRNVWRHHALQVTGVDIPPPIKHFSSLVRPPLRVPRNVVTNLFDRQHSKPSPVQMQAIPALVHGRDVLACAPTGSGKTIAFLVPMFAQLRAPDPSCGVRAVIVTPTLELAEQIEREAFFLMKGQRWRFVQHGQTTRNKDIFISTPRRVVSLVEKGLLDLARVQYLVFDEGDRLWDVKTNFLEDVDKIIAASTRPEKVVALFTATLSDKVETAARSVMSDDPIRIIVSGRQSVNPNVQQRLVFCGNELGKIVAMRNLIREGVTPPVLIFVQSIERCDELYDEIRTQGLPLAVMNAKMTTEEREETVLRFRLGRIWILITTELLSRGIDFKNVGTVINFDFPGTVDSYIHRVGRTGRAGKKGTAITFFTEDDRLRLPAIAKVMRESGSEVEDWMLDIRVAPKTQRRLERETPRRAIISTRKRILVGRKRTAAQIRRMEREEERRSGIRNPGASCPADGDDGDDGDDE